MTDVSRYILYARKSTESEDKQMLSIPAQLRELRAFAARVGIVIAEELTESYSAREPGRPVFSRLLKDIAAGKIHGIVCWKPDRLARNPIDGGALIHHLGKALQEIVTPESRYNGSADSKFMLSVIFGAATKMTDDLSVAVKRGNRETRERGRITGNPPLGYLKVRDRPGLRGAGKVVPDPERFHLVQRIWKELATGTTTVSAVWRKAVHEWGLTTRPTPKRPSHPIVLSHLYQLLDSRFYAGQIVGAGEVYQGEHEPMITPAEFERVQDCIRHPNGPRPSKHRFLYSGLLHCGACGRIFVGEDIKNRYDRHYIYYRCGRRRDGRQVCRALAPTEQQVTTDIERALGAATLDPRLVDWTLEAVDWWAARERSSAVALAQGRKQELEKAERDQRRLTDLVVAGTLDEAEYVTRRAESLARIHDLRRAIDDPTAEIEAWREAARELVTLGGTLLQSFQEADREARRGLLGRLYENLVVNDRITKPVLRSELCFLDGSCPPVTLPSGRDANLPHPSKIWPRTRQNARLAGSRERAFQVWCTRLWDVRTTDTAPSAWRPA